MISNSIKSIAQASTVADHDVVTPALLRCVCNRDITLTELMKAYPDRKRETIEKFLFELNSAMTRYGITKCIQKIHFVAQVGHESSELKYTAEVLPKGKTEDNLYGGYKGRGLIQITGKSNYKSYGDFIKADLTGDNRLKLEEPDLASDSAAWFWVHGTGEDFNAAADANDLIYISAKINGAFNGYDGQPTSRLELLKKAALSFQVSLCSRLQSLFQAFPEKDQFSYDDFVFADSKAYNLHDMAFAWGFWHDPLSKMKGTRKDPEQAKAGYVRYLDLQNKKTKSTPARRFGLARLDMASMADQRLRALNK